MMVLTLLLTTAAATRAVAQVPSLAELGSTWQPVRVCRASAPTQPCPAGGNLGKKACADYGCCFDGRSCFAPNGDQPPNGSQQVFAAGQAVPAIAQPGAALSVDSGADLLAVQCFDAPPFAGVCGGPLTFGQLHLDGAPSASLAVGTSSRWRPHEIVRNATLWRTGGGGGVVHGSSSVRMSFDTQTILLRLELEALTHGQAPLNLSVSLAALVFAQTNMWEWPIARPNGDGMAASIRGNGALTTHTQSNTSSASTFSSTTPVPTLALLNTPSPHVIASWTGLQLSVGVPVVLELTLAVGHDPSIVEHVADQVAQDFGAAWAAAQTDWEEWWQSAFDPAMHEARLRAHRPAFGPAVKFEGQLPTLRTEDAALRRVYYMGAVTLLTMARHDTVPGSQWEGTLVFGSAGVECAVTAMYIWDTTLNSLLLTLLAPTYFQSMIAAWFSMGVHAHYAIDFVTNRGIGPWYAFNDMMVFRAMDTMARFGAKGPQHYTQSTMIQNKSMLTWMAKTATYWQTLVDGTAHVEAIRPPLIRDAPAPACNLSGVWWGCHGSTPIRGGCDFAGPVEMTATAGSGHTIQIRASWQEGIKKHFWATASGNATMGGRVSLDLFSANGQPYPALHVLRGTVEECGVFKWADNTVWCKNGSGAACTQSPPPPADGLADYGRANNLLECVPSYIHKVPSLNAANAWMMRQVALLSSANASRVEELKAAADQLSKLVRTKLYIAPAAGAAGAGSGGYWACEQPNGQLVPVRHVIDFITVGAALLDDLSNQTRAEMVAFVKRELLTKNWMRALSMEDAAAPASDRKDRK
eukprot:COSAG01_NODE_6650_length_3563_cov_2.465358_1_plen_808_part_00